MHLSGSHSCASRARVCGPAAMQPRCNAAQVQCIGARDGEVSMRKFPGAASLAGGHWVKGGKEKGFSGFWASGRWPRACHVRRVCEVFKSAN